MTTFKGPEDDLDLGKMILFTHIDQAEKALVYKDYQNTIFHSMQILYLIKKKNLNDLKMPYHDYSELVPLVAELAPLPLIENSFDICYEEINALSLILQALVSMNFESVAMSIIAEYFKSAAVVPFVIRQLEIKLLTKMHLFEQAETKASLLSSELHKYPEEQDGVLEKQSKVASLLQSIKLRQSQAKKTPDYEPPKAVPIEDTIIEEKTPNAPELPVVQPSSTPNQQQQLPLANTMPQKRQRAGFWQTVWQHWTQDGAVGAYSLFALVALVFTVYKVAKSNSGQRLWHSLSSLLKAAFTFV